MPNEQLIDTVISPGVDAQVTSLTKLLENLDIVMIADIKSANALNTALSNSKSFADYNKTATAAGIQLEKVQQAQNKTAQTTVTLNAAQAKAAFEQQARDDKAAAALIAKQNRQAAADAKEIANAEAKAAKLAAIQKKANKDGEIFIGTTPVDEYQQAQGSDLPPISPEEADRRKAAYYANKPEQIAAQKEQAIATEEETSALKRQQEALAQLSPEYVANIELLERLKAEQLENAAALKLVNTETVQGAEYQTVLIANQLRLKTAVQQTNLTLAQQTKQLLAEDTSGAMMQARLDELRVAIQNLSKADLENIEIGGVWIAEAEKLDLQIKALRDSTGDHTKHVGDYERAQLKATNATELAEKVSAKLVTQLVRMAAQFILITVVLGAATWLYDWIKNLDIFTGRLDQATQNLKAFNEVQKNAASDAGQMVGKYQILSDAIKDLNISYEDRLKAAIELKKLFPEELEHSTAQAIASGEEADALDRLKDSVVALAKAKAAAKEIEKQEGEIIALQMQMDKVNTAKANEALRYQAQRDREIKTFGANSPSQMGSKTVGEAANAVLRENLRQSKNAADQANKDIKAQISVKEQTVKALEQYGNLQKEAESIDDKKQAKTPKPKDYGNTDLLEANRIDIEEAKKRNKAIFLDDNYSHEARLVALDQYLKKSKDLLDNSAEIIKADANMRAQQRLNALKKLKNEELDIENERIVETERLNKEEIEKRKRHLAEIIELSKESEQEQLETLQNGANLALRILTEAKDKRINAISLERAQGKISEQEYNRELLAIADQFAIDRINQEIATQQSILAIKEGRRDATALRMKVDGATPEDIAKFVSGANKGIQPTKDKLAGLGDDLTNAQSKQTVDNTKSGDKEAEERRKAQEFAAQQTIKAIDEIDSLRQKAFEAEISRLEKLKEQVDENANNEKLQVQNSIASNATKARQIAVIDAQAAAQKKAIDAQEAKAKEKAAVADKEAAIAKIILNTAIAAIKAPAELGPILGLAAVPIVLALGAVELALAVATPIPKYARGTDNYPGGLGIWGEAGMERADLPDGTVHYSHGASLANFPRGTKITPHIELMQQIRPANVGYVGGSEIGWPEVVKAIKDNKQERARMRVVVNVDAGYEAYKRGYLSR